MVVNPQFSKYIDNSAGHSNTKSIQRNEWTRPSSKIEEVSGKKRRYYSFTGASLLTSSFRSWAISSFIWAISLFFPTLDYNTRYISLITQQEKQKLTKLLIHVRNFHIAQVCPLNCLKKCWFHNRFQQYCPMHPLLSPQARTQPAVLPSWYQQNGNSCSIEVDRMGFVCEFRQPEWLACKETKVSVQRLYWWMKGMLTCKVIHHPDCSSPARV